MAIQTQIGVATISDHKGRVTRKESYLISRFVLSSLHSIKDATVEEHTRSNVQRLIDQIEKADPTL